MSKTKAHEGRVAVVTGAGRGGGRGIAFSLGEAGATVHVDGTQPPPYRLLQDTLGTRLGGTR